MRETPSTLTDDNPDLNITPDAQVINCPLTINISQPPTRQPRIKLEKGMVSITNEVKGMPYSLASAIKNATPTQGQLVGTLRSQIDFPFHILWFAQVDQIIPWSQRSCLLLLSCIHWSLDAVQTKAFTAYWSTYSFSRCGSHFSLLVGATPEEISTKLFHPGYETLGRRKLEPFYEWKVDKVALISCNRPAMEIVFAFQPARERLIFSRSGLQSTKFNLEEKRGKPR